MSDNGAGADLGGSENRSGDRWSRHGSDHASPSTSSAGAFGDLTASPESDDFVDSILSAADRDVAARLEAGPLTGEVPAAAPVEARRAPAAVPQPAPAPGPIDPFLSQGHAGSNSVEQKKQADYDDFWSKSPTSDEADFFSAEAGTSAPAPATDPAWGGEATEVVPPQPSRASDREPTGSPLQMMMSNEPRFVMAAGALIALGLICVIIGAIVLT